MNILNTITAYPPSIGGAQIHQHILNRNLNKKHNIQVLTHWNNNRTDWLLGTTLNAPSESINYVLDNINIHRFGIHYFDKLRILPYVLAYYCNISFNSSMIARCFEKYINEYVKQADLIHNVRIGRENISFASYNSARKKDIPFVLTPLHHPRWIGWRYRAYIDLYKNADAIIALTLAEKEILIHLGVKEDKIIITGIGPVLGKQANPNNFLSEYKIDSPFVLFLGQHYLYKGFREILQAMNVVWKKHSSINFVFIGPSVKDSEVFFEQYRDPRVHRLGKVDLQTKTDALAACHLLCVPSTQESFGGIYTEAWSFKKPVIGCQIPAVRNVITNEIDGVLVDQEPTEIANSICELLNDYSKAKLMGEAGYKKVQEKYNWQIISQKVSDLYHSLI